MSSPDSEDDIIESLEEAVRSIAEKVEITLDHGLLIIGAKCSQDEHGDKVKAFTVVSGFLGVIAEGLYAELADQIESGNKVVFAVLRQVIHDLEKDFEITEESLEQDLDGSSSSLH